MAMQPPLRNADYSSMIKCTSCAADIDLASVTHHVCQQAAPAFYQQSTYGHLPDPYSQYDQSQHEYHPREPSPVNRQRPTLPKLDSSMNGRSGLRPSEAASIAHDLGLPSPVSAGGSSNRSPSRSRSRHRKPILVRPPSPDLPISQDCAFPPFPMKPKRSQPPVKENKTHKPHSISRSTTSTKQYQHSSSQSNASSVYSAGSGHIKRRTSNTSSGYRSRQGTTDDSMSMASTAPTSPRQSAFSPISREYNVERLPPPPVPTFGDSYTSSESSPSIPTMPPTPSWPFDSKEPSPRIVQSPSSETGWTPTERAIPEEYLAEVEGPGYAKSQPNKSETFDKIMPSEQVQPVVEISDNPSKEPLYKTKRPAPLLQPPQHVPNDPHMPLSARAPPPPQSNHSLTRTLTNLFGRKRSQSIATKTMPLPTFDSPRMRALAPDPPERPQRGDSLWDDALPSADSKDHWSPSHASHDHSHPHETEAMATETSSDILGTYPHLSREAKVSGETAEFEFNLEHEGRPQSTPDDPDKPLSDHHDFATEDPEFSHEPLQSEPDLSRASMDSASSYGSIGFSTHRTASSRSSPPTSVDIRRKISMGKDLELPSTAATSLIVPSRSLSNDTAPDSPTDPFYQAGKLSPVPESEPLRWSQNADMDRSPPNPVLSPPSELVRQDSPKNSRPETPAGIKGRCRGCSNLIVTGQKSVASADGRLTGRYHKECFACQTCREPFATADFYVFEDDPYCAYHYHVLNNTLCTGCGKGIEGQYLETFDVAGQSSKKFHSKCLQCSTCKIQLGEDYFEFHGRVYCERDAFRAASGPQGPRSPYDTIPVRPSPLVREVIHSEEPGFKGRFPERRITRLMMG